MSIDWTRIAVQLGNEARTNLDAGDFKPAVARYREALEALPRGRPTLDALFHYGLAEAYLEARAYPEAARALARSLRMNRALGNHEGVDAGCRLRARLRQLDGRRLSAAERQELDLVLELGVRPMQYRLRAAGRRPRLLVEVWERLPHAAAATPRRAYLFAVDRLRTLSAEERRRLRQELPRVGIAFRAAGDRGVRLTVVEDLGGRDTMGRTLWLVRRGREWSIRKERLVPT